MRWNRSLIMGVAFGALTLAGAGAHARSAAPAERGVSAPAPPTSARSTAGRPLAAAAEYVEGAMSSAGQIAETGITTGLKAAESLGERLVSKTTAGTERAWTTAADTVRRAMEKLSNAV